MPALFIAEASEVVLRQLTYRVELQIELLISSHSDSMINILDFFVSTVLLPT